MRREIRLVVAAAVVGAVPGVFHTILYGKMRAPRASCVCRLGLLLSFRMTDPTRRRALPFPLSMGLGLEVEESTSMLLSFPEDDDVAAFSRENREMEGTAERDAMALGGGTNRTASAVANAVGTRRNELLGTVPLASILDRTRRFRLSTLAAEEKDGLRVGRDRCMRVGDGDVEGVRIEKSLEKEESSEFCGGGEREGVRSCEEDVTLEETDSWRWRAYGEGRFISLSFYKYECQEKPSERIKLLTSKELGSVGRSRVCSGGSVGR